MTTSSLAAPLWVAWCSSQARRLLIDAYERIVIPRILARVRRAAIYEVEARGEDAPQLARLIITALDESAACEVARVRSELFARCRERAATYWRMDRYASSFLGTLFAELIEQKDRLLQTTPSEVASR